jgi:hypothetical protein
VDPCLYLEVFLESCCFFNKSNSVFVVAFPPMKYPLLVAFYAISLLSPMRWAYELVVLIIMEPYVYFVKAKKIIVDKYIV